jgi:hypothetical protein
MEPKGKENNSDQQNNDPLGKKSHIGKPPPSIDNEKQSHETDGESDCDKNNPPKGFSEQWKIDSPANRIIAVFTVLLGLTAIPLVIIGICQAKYSRDSITEAQKALKYTRLNDSLNSVDQKRISDNSISLSMEIAATQKRFAKIETRAYIVVTGINSLALTTFKPGIISYTILNSGRTPANKVNAAQIIKFGGTGIYQHEVISFEKSLSNEVGMQTVSPGIPVVIENEIMKEISKNDSVEIFNNKKSLFIGGIISYTDMFGDKDTTKYCFRFVPPGGFKTITNYNIIK